MDQQYDGHEPAADSAGGSRSARARARGSGCWTWTGERVDVARTAGGLIPEHPRFTLAVVPDTQYQFDHDRGIRRR